VVAATLVVFITTGIEARAQQQIDIRNGTSRPMLFQVAIPSPQNPAQPMYLTEQMTLYPNEVGHWQVPAGSQVQLFPAPDGSIYGNFGYQAFDPWTNAPLLQGGNLFGAIGMPCTTTRFNPALSPPVTIFQTVVP
jgi:hypothetical protein